ncbi:MAG: MATE family efflux transporter [Lachnospiraceae bacterium]|nr:MATE family efflux transporter [Lachnospiraceae bacterium]
MGAEKKSVFAKIAAFFTVRGMMKGKSTLGEVPTTKDAYTNFFKVAWPSAIESLLVGLVGSVDTMMVGTLGEGAIAAVGITNQPKFILLALIFSLNVGVTAVVSRRKGQNDREGANRVLRVCILLSGLISMTTSALGFLFAKPILLFAGAQQDYLVDAEIYFRILVVSLFFTALNLTINAAQRGVGKTKISMRTNVIANVVNLIFNYLLINGVGFFPKLGVAGAAIATCLGAMAACAISFLTLLQKNGYLSFFYKCSWKITRTIIAPVFKVSSSAFVEQVFMRIGFLLYAVIVARLGTTPYATHLICMNIISLSFCFGDGFGIAASALVGQNLGAKRPDLSMLYGKVGQRIAFLVSTVLFFIFIFGRTFLITLFSREPEIIALGAQIMIIVAFSTHAQSSQVVLSGCLRGAGDTRFVALVSILSIALIRPSLTWLLCFPLGMGLIGAWVTLIIDQFLRFICSYMRFNSGKWQKISL